jgi:hypothetical protein
MPIEMIKSNRLDPALLELQALRLSRAGEAAALERPLGLEAPADWFQQQALISIRLQQVTNWTAVESIGNFTPSHHASRPIER